MRHTQIYLLKVNSPPDNALRLWMGEESSQTTPLFRKADG